MPIVTPELLRYYNHCSYMSEKYGSMWLGRLYARDPQIGQADIDQMNRLRSASEEAEKKEREHTRLEVKQMKQRRLNRRMRYCYHNRAYLTSGASHGLYCDPVKRAGKVVRGRGGNQLVRFADGTLAVVVARALRLRHKCKDAGHRKGE